MASNASRTLIKIKTAKMYNNITVERLEQIQEEREQTYADNAYQRWMKELNVSSMYIDKIPLLNAREAMSEWDTSKFNKNKIHITQ